ncbi:MAG: PHB depolymerase family esterase [Anaerolineales bacterium]
MKRLLLALLLLSACSRSLTPPAAPTLVSGTALQPGDFLRVLSVGGLERSYRLHVPSSFSLERPSALVLAFHGGGGNADNMVRLTGFDALAEQEGFLVVYPNGTGRLDEKLLTWNGGECCGYAQEQNVDDVAFVRAIVDDLRAFATLDESRIYATGISNGGILSYRLACDAADLFAAIAPVAGTLNYPSCSPTEPVSVLHIHGSADEHLPYDGGVGKESLTGVTFASVADSLRFWTQFNHCDPAPLSSQQGNLRHATYANCAPGGQVELYAILGGLHAWPGAEVPAWPGGDEPSQDLEASQVIWEFFAAHPKP